MAQLPGVVGGEFYISVKVTSPNINPFWRHTFSFRNKLAYRRIVHRVLKRAERVMRGSRAENQTPLSWHLSHLEFGYPDGKMERSFRLAIFQIDSFDLETIGANLADEFLQVSVALHNFSENRSLLVFGTMGLI